MIFRSLITIGLVILFASCGSEEEAASSTETGAKVEMSHGQKLFNDYCLQCHSLVANKVGPSLRGALERWDNDTSRIAAFIKNAKETIDSGDPRAVQVAEEWNNTLMTPMPHLTDEDIAALLEYMAK